MIAFPMFRYPAIMTVPSLQTPTFSQAVARPSEGSFTIYSPPSSVGLLSPTLPASVTVSPPETCLALLTQPDSCLSSCDALFPFNVLQQTAALLGQQRDQRLRCNHALTVRLTQSSTALSSAVAGLSKIAKIEGSSQCMAELYAKLASILLVLP